MPTQSQISKWMAGSGVGHDEVEKPHYVPTFTVNASVFAGGAFLSHAAVSI